ncbi:helix-turn-helix transcriptional regulator [Fulvimarina sp. MAC3]|uniref:helix-turn-helix domain-containing protein n=1 Tax=unclassified Fulvimarina TaxID=2618750 RepID=UPI0031FD6DD4
MYDTKAASHIDKSVGAKIKLGRLMAGLSREKLGVQLGISWQQIQKYESGANRVSAGRLHQIAHILGREIQWFFDEADNEPSDIGPSPRDIGMARKFNKLASDRKKALEALIDEMARP